MGFFVRRRTTLGLDVGSGFAKLVEVDHSGSQAEVVSAAVGAIHDGAVADGEVVDSGAVAKSVRELVASAGVRGRDVVLALGGHDVFVKRMEVACTIGMGVPAAVRAEAERHVPFDVGRVQIDFHILGPVADTDKLEVLLVAAKREAIEKRVALATDAGLNPVVVDVETFALHNALACNHSCAAGTVALLHVGHETTTVSILDDNALILTRDFPLGSKEAARAARTKGRRDAVRSVADGLAEAVQSLVAFLSARRSAFGLGRVFLSGGGACDPLLAESTAGRMSVETTVANPFKQVAVRSGASCFGGELGDVSPMLMLALGLALRCP